MLATLPSTTPSPDSPTVAATLAGLIERFSAPDLTASEAEALRPRLMGLLDSLHAPDRAASGALAPHPVPGA